MQTYREKTPDSVRTCLLIHSHNWKSVEDYSQFMYSTHYDTGSELVFGVSIYDMLL